MSQGTFTASNSGASTTNYTDDTAMYFIGGGTFTGPPDWTQLQTNPITTTPPNRILTTGGSSWTVSGTGGSGKILSIMLQTNLDDYDNKYVIVVLQTGGGTFLSGAGNNFNPPPPACFVTGTRVLTNTGYKAVEDLVKTDKVMTSDNRAVPFKLVKFSLAMTTTESAPYRIEQGAFGKNIPSAPLSLSPKHMIQIREQLWICPEIAAIKTRLVKQYGVGEPVTYYHIQCENFLRDNLIAEGAIVESFGTMRSVKGRNDIYKWNTKLGGFTRLSYTSVSKRNL